jgi:hypothetical protein
MITSAIYMRRVDVTDAGEKDPLSLDACALAVFNIES